MTILAQPNHPARLAGVFAASVGAFALLAAAALAAMYVFDSETSSAVVPDLFPAGADVDLPSGLVLVSAVPDADAWETHLGFAPIEPAAVPEGIGEPLYYVQQPDTAGRPAGHLRYSTEDGGLLLVVIEQAGRLSADRPMRSAETPMTREHIETFGCRGVIVTAQLFFSIDRPDAPSVTTTLAVADEFIGGMKQQCR